jgi:hypothetical protein
MQEPNCQKGRDKEEVAFSWIVLFFFFRPSSGENLTVFRRNFQNIFSAFLCLNSIATVASTPLGPRSWALKRGEENAALPHSPLIPKN